MHHSLVVGVGGMRMLQKMMVPYPKASALSPPWAIGRGPCTRPAPASGPLMLMLGKAVQKQFDTAPQVGKALGRLVTEHFKRANSAEALPFSGPASILNRRVSGQRRFATQYYPLDRVKAVAKAVGVTVNDVFLGLCAGAMRR